MIFKFSQSWNNKKCNSLCDYHLVLKNFSPYVYRLLVINTSSNPIPPGISGITVLPGDGKSLWHLFLFGMRTVSICYNVVRWAGCYCTKTRNIQRLLDVKKFCAEFLHKNKRKWGAEQTMPGNAISQVKSEAPSRRRWLVNWSTINS